MKIKAAVIGCGGISRFHFTGLSRAGAEILWACDLDYKAAVARAESVGARSTSDLGEVLADPEVNTIVVATGSASHKSICLAAIEAGKSVICEKTLAETPEDAWQIVESARRKGTIFYTSYMKRFIPAVTEAKKRLPDIGRIISVHIRTHQPWGDLWEKIPTEGFFHTPPGGHSQVVRNYGGGILLCGGSHMVDLVLFLLGRPTRVYARLHVPDGLDYDVQASAILETGNGTVHFEALAHPLREIGFLRDGWDERIEITGTRGRLEILSAQWDDPERKCSRLIHTEHGSGVVHDLMGPAESPFDRAIAFYCGNIARGEQGTLSRLTGYEADEVLAHLKASGEIGQAMEIQWKGKEQ
ncbi:Gfo/Idh/MocA family protein [Puniceicoccus vermicola]|uniref:Gfo/Idh/MocA family oxidoreductase n=1 Tax=Puniceicoccus vermicola TaxID=388746 RepID=A0A7X1B0C5_9BACT|nr:Gfo/Idh/MocA family oxidoreductase [Puniceicoccus vermicola]MBC2603254.1 Gfo/Idh/MocA family oxidoreductase [Puniceicoccus vermicola]